MPSEEDFWFSKLSQLKEKLSVRHSSIQRSGVWSYVHSIDQENKGGEIKKEPRGLLVLRDVCCRNSSPLVVESFLQGIVWLVNQKVLSVDGAVNILIESLEKLPQSCLALLVGILFQLLRSKTTEYSSDIFVSLIKRRPELILEIIAICQVSCSSESPLLLSDWHTFLSPIFGFIIQSNRAIGQVYSYRSMFFSFLIDQLHCLASSPENQSNNSWELFKYLSEQLEHIPVSSSLDFLFHLEFLQKLVTACELLYQRNILSQSDYMVSLRVYFSHLISLWSEMHQNSLISLKELQIESVSLTKDTKDTFVCEGIYAEVFQGRTIGLLIAQVKKVFRLISVLPDLETSYHLDVNNQKNILLLSFLLIDNMEDQQKEILKILDDFLVPALATQPFCRLFIFPRLIYPLLQIMSSPTEQLKSVASKLLYRLEKFSSLPLQDTPSSESNKDDRSTVLQITPIAPSAVCVKIFYLLDCAVEFYLNAADINLTVLLCSYIKNMSKRMQEEASEQSGGESAASASFLIFWISPFLFHASPDVRSVSCNLLQRISTTYPESTIGLLPFLMYQSEKERNPKVQTKILSCIPELASHPQMLAPVYRTLSPLVSDPIVAPFALRLLCKLWQKQDRAFRKFRDLLLSQASRKDYNDNIKLSVAVCIRDICMEGPSRGKEFISLIAEFIKDSDPFIKSWGLQALTHLCIADCVEFSTAWEIIEEDIRDDDRSIVLEHRMRLFESGIENLDVENEFTILHLDQLWMGACSEHSNVRKYSYLVLRQFYDKDPLCITLRRSREEQLRVILDKEEESSAAGVELGKKILREEISHSRRQIELAAESNSLYSSLGKLPEYLESSYVESKRPAVASGLAGGNLFCFVPNTTKKSSGTIHGELLVHARSYRVRLNELLEEVFMNTWITRVVGLFAWIRFSSKYMNVLIQSEKAKYQLELENAPVDQPPVEKDFYAETMMQLRSVLAEKRVLTPAASENCVMALTGFTLALPVSKNEFIHDSLRYLISLLSSDSSNEREQFACYISLASLTNALPLSDMEQVKQIHETLSSKLSDSPDNIATTNEWNQFACSFGLGLIAFGLIQKQKSHMLSEQSQQAAELVDKIRSQLVHKLNSKSNRDSKSILGVCIGLSYLVSSYSNSAELLLMFKNLQSLLEDSLTETRSIFLSGICLVLSSTVLRCYRLNLINNEAITTAIASIKNLAFPPTSSQGNLGACIALGALIQGSILYGYNCSQRDIESAVDSFLCLANSSKISDSLRESCLLGMANMLGANLIVPLDGTLSLLESTEFLFSSLNNSEDFSFSSSLVGNLKGLFENSKNSNRLNIFAGWMLGSIARPLPPRSFSSSTVSLLKQLPEGSLLKALLQHLHTNIEELQGAGITETQKTLLYHQTEKILDALCEVPARKLPLIDWTPLLQQLVKGEVNLNSRLAAFRFGIHNSTNSAVAHLLSCALEVGDFIHLPIEIQLLFLNEIPSLINSFATNRSIQLLTDHSSLIIQTMLKSNISSNNLKSISLWAKSLAKLLSSGKISASLQEAAAKALHEFLVSIPIPIVKPDDQKQCRYPFVIDFSLAQIFAQIAEQCAVFTDEQINGFFNVSNNDYTEKNIKSFLWRSLFVKNKRLPLSQLVALRSFCFSHPDVSFSSVMLVWMSEAVRDVSSAVQRTWYRDCLDCLLVLKSPLVILRFIGWITMIWSSHDMDCLLQPMFNVTKAGNMKRETNEKEISASMFQLAYLVFTIEKLVPYTLSNTLLQFAKETPQDAVIEKQILLLNQKLIELRNTSSQCENPSSKMMYERVYLILKHTTVLVQRQTGK